MALRPDWLVLTKLQPPLLHADTIERQRLVQSLRTALASRPVTLISAPAGYGKTTLLASLPSIMPELRIAWLSLEGEENDPPRFLGALIAALQRLNPAVGAGALASLTSEPRHVVALLINEIIEHLPSPFALILDDLHFVTEPRIHAALDFLIERLPPQMRLVIATRHDPPLALARLMARRQIAEVRRPHLSFTPDEVARLLNDSLGLGLAPAELDALTARTEGWAAGLCLLASSLERITTQSGRAALLTGLAQTDRYVFDFLAAEVLDHQESAVRTFLLRSSILSELTAPLCAAVTGEPESGRLLAELYQKNLFLVLDESGSYRYHALFAEFLRRRLAEEEPALLAELHHRAAVAQPSPTRAIGHFLAAERFAEAAEAIEDAGPRLLLEGLSATLSRWGQPIPQAVKERYPALCFILGRALIFQGDYPAAYAMNRLATEGFARAGSIPDQANTLIAMCSCAMLMGETSTVRVHIEQFFTLPDLPPGTVARGLGALAYLRTYDQDWAEAAAAVQDAMTITTEAKDLAAAVAISHLFGPWVAVLPASLGPLERFCAAIEAGAPPGASGIGLVVNDLRAATSLLRGRLDEAAAQADRSLAIKERIGGYGWLGFASHMTLATVATVRGEQDEALRHAANLLQLQQSAVDQVQLWLYVAGRTYWLWDHQAEAAQVLARMTEPTTPTGFPMAPALQRRLAGLLALGKHRLTEAESLFRETVRLEEEYPLSLAAGSGRVLLARALLEQERTAEAMAELRTLLALCLERGMPGLLLQEGSLIRPLLHRLVASDEAGSALAASALVQLGDPPGKAVAGGPPPAVGAGAGGGVPALLAEPLTERELEVLRLLVTGLTNREIARVLIIGEETVKTHVARILHKLDAPTRAGAGARARELGLL